MAFFQNTCFRVESELYFIHRDPVMPISKFSGMLNTMAICLKTLTFTVSRDTPSSFYEHTLLLTK